MEALPQRRTRVKKIIAVLDKTYPDAVLALHFENPLQLLVALILAAQARDERVNSVTEKLFKKYRSADAFAREKSEKLQEQVKQINFYRRKSAAIQAACRMLVEEHGGKVPAELDQLLQLPGVGRKTANIIRGNAFGEPAIGVDTHVARVSERLGLTENTDPDKIEADLTEIVPEKNQVRFCHLLQAHGRAICVAKKPRCPECPVREVCLYPNKTR